MEEDDLRSLPQAGAEETRELRASVRKVAHDFNGALNNMVLNLELLERALRADGAAPVPGSERCLANLRRALGQLTLITSRRLAPLAQSPAESTEI